MWDWVCFTACAAPTRFFLCNFGLQIALSVSKTGFCNCFLSLSVLSVPLEEIFLHPNLVFCFYVKVLAVFVSEYMFLPSGSQALGSPNCFLIKQTQLRWFL